LAGQEQVEPLGALPLLEEDVAGGMFFDAEVLQDPPAIGRRQPLKKEEIFEGKRALRHGLSAMSLGAEAEQN
jgi:hypothetical protein